VFSGRFDHAIDEKGRVSIPARFREVLQRDGDETLMITNWAHLNERCLALYPPNQWKKLIGKLSQGGIFDPVSQTLQLFVLGGAHEVQVDRQGRILIPPNLRDYARFERDVTFSAMTDNFQLWDRAVLQRVVEAAAQQISNQKFLAKWHE
jgi:MraZ protein